MCGVSKKYLLELCSDLIDDVIKLKRENTRLKNEMTDINEYVDKLKLELKGMKKQMYRLNNRLDALDMLGFYE